MTALLFVMLMTPLSSGAAEDTAGDAPEDEGVSLKFLKVVVQRGKSAPSHVVDQQVVQVRETGIFEPACDPQFRK